jgi:hypothetical protein
VVGGEQVGRWGGRVGGGAGEVGEVVEEGSIKQRDGDVSAFGNARSNHALRWPAFRGLRVGCVLAPFLRFGACVWLRSNRSVLRFRGCARTPSNGGGGWGGGGGRRGGGRGAGRRRRGGRAGAGAGMGGRWDRGRGAGGDWVGGAGGSGGGGGGWGDGEGAAKWPQLRGGGEGRREEGGEGRCRGMGVRGSAAEPGDLAIGAARSGAAAANRGNGQGREP